MIRSPLTAGVLVLAIASTGGPAFAQGAPPGGSGKPPAAKPDKGKDKPKDEPKPGTGNPAQAAVFATDVMVLHATNGGKGIDPRIGNMPELKKPPFSSYDSYELLEKKRLPLDKNEQTMNLPNRRILKTQLV